MTAPQLTAQIQGQGTVSADNLNTYVQWCVNITQLRAFIGLPNMQVFVEGTISPGDGGQGIFYWNSTSLGPDNGTTIIVPQPGVPGAWVMIPTSESGPVNVENIASLRAFNGGVSTPVIFLEGYYTIADGGDGMFVYNPNDLTSADNGGTIIIDSDGHRYYRETGGQQWSALWFGGNLQEAVNALASTGGNLLVPQGTYTLTSTLNMHANIKLVLENNAIITQGNGLNLSSLINFSANSANNSGISGGIIDGNIINNSTLGGTIGVAIGTANNVTIQNVTLRNISGFVINVTNGLYPIITNNTITNYYGFYGISITASTVQTKTNGIITGNIFIPPLGGHAISVMLSDGNIISNNIVTAQQVTGMTVTVSGTSVTSSGTGINNFLTNTNGGPIQVGSFIIVGNGSTTEVELYVISVNSASSLTVSETSPTYTNFSAIAGPGDLISVGSASDTTISNNEVSGGSAGGIVVSDEGGAESVDRVTINGNRIYSSGNAGIAFETGNTGSQVFNCSITGNFITNAGKGGNATGGNVGILIEPGGDPLYTIFVDGNFVSNIAGTTCQYWMSVSGLAVGQNIQCGKNGSYQMVNPGIQGGISSITLGAGWGSTASVSSIITHGSSMEFIITSSGTGQSVNPEITINTVTTSTSQPPLALAIMVSGTGAIAPIAGGNATDDSASSIVLLYTSTPVAGDTYNINVMI